MIVLPAGILPNVFTLSKFDTTVSSDKLDSIVALVVGRNGATSTATCLMHSVSTYITVASRSFCAGSLLSIHGVVSSMYLLARLTIFHISFIASGVDRLSM